MQKRKYRVIKVTPEHVIYEIAVFTPGAGWDGGTLKTTVESWRAKHPQYRNPKPGLTFELG